MHTKQRYRRVLGYIRVSGLGQEKHGTSLEGQDERIRAICRAEGLPDPEIRLEVESAGDDKFERRVELHALIEDAKPGDLIITPKVDRWSRDLSWGVGSVRALVKRGVGWRSIDENIDASTSEGDDHLGLRMWVADQERKRIKERTVGTRRRLRALGMHVEGLPPLGYKVEKRKLVIVPEQAEMVRRMFSLCIAGLTTRQIARSMRTEYPSSIGLDHAAVARRLRDRRYIGETNTIGQSGRRKPLGEWIHTHEPIIDQATWHRAQEALIGRARGGRPASGHARTSGFMMRGIMQCASCGRVVSAWAPDRHASTKHGGYYQCVGKCVRARQDEVDAHVDAEAVARLELLVERLSRPAKAKTKVVNVASEKARLAKKRARIVDALADDTITKDDARRKLDEIAAQVAELDARLAETVPEDRGERLREMTELRRAWSSATVEEKRRILRMLAERFELASTRTKKWQRGAWSMAVSWRDVD